MLHTFLANNRDELIVRCRSKVALRPARGASALQLENGVPLFLEQLIETLKIEQPERPSESLIVSGSPGGNSGRSEIGEAAARHGHERLTRSSMIMETSVRPLLTLHMNAMPRFRSTSSAR
ncbi:protein of unknown function (plasmid) [Caballeronia sp. S22]